MKNQNTERWKPSFPKKIGRKYRPIWNRTEQNKDHTRIMHKMGQNLTWIFSNLRVFTFYKSIMGCSNQWTRMDQRGHHMIMNFDYFQIQKWMLQTVRVEKIDEKNEVIFLFFMFPYWVMTLKLSKKVHFLQFRAEFSNKPKSVKAIYILHRKVLTKLFKKLNGL